MRANPQLSQEILDFLGKADAYQGPTTAVERLETHISRVFLTDRFAYKLKKPVRFDFLDFSTPEARRTACEAEVRLNRRLAPDVYLGVLPITRGPTGALKLGGDAPAIDWVVKMRRLPAHRMLDALIGSRQLTPADIGNLARVLTRFFQQAPPLSVDPQAYRQTIEDHVRANREVLIDADPEQALLIRQVHAAQLRFLWLHAAEFDQRVNDRRILEGHGDLRPEHVCLEDVPVIFDCIEFDFRFRQIDAADELAFLAMECDRLGASQVGQQILEAYCRSSGDHVSEPMWNFYQSYRACVRAKVAALRVRQIEPAGQERESAFTRSYLTLAERAAKSLGPPLEIIVSGLMGTGKSTLASRLADLLGAELLQTDQIRRELPAMAAATTGRAEYDSENYRLANRARVYDEIGRRAAVLLSQGMNVILDGTFLLTEWRQAAVENAASQGAATIFIRCICPPDVALDRIARRADAGGSLSDARPEHFQLQQNEFEPDPPGLWVLNVDTTLPLEKQVERVRQSLAENDLRLCGQVRHEVCGTPGSPA